MRKTDTGIAFIILLLGAWTPLHAADAPKGRS